MNYSIGILEGAINSCEEECWHCERGLERHDSIGKKNHDRCRESIKHNDAAIVEMQQAIKYLRSI